MKKPCSSWLRCVYACGLLASASPGQEPLQNLDRPVPFNVFERIGTHHATLEGRVVDPNGEPVAECQVLVYDYVPYYWALVAARTTTDESGHYQLDIPNTGGPTHVFVVSPEDRPFAMASRSFTAASAANLRLPDLEIEIPESQDQEPVELRGQVLDSDGEGCQGVLVRAYGSSDTFDPTAIDVTKADGSFLIRQRNGDRSALQLFFPNRRIDIEQGPSATLKNDFRWSIDLSQDELTLQHEDFKILTVDDELLGEGERVFLPRGVQRVACEGTKIPFVKGRYSVRATVWIGRPGSRLRSAVVSDDEETSAPTPRARHRLVDADGERLELSNAAEAHLDFVTEGRRSQDIQHWGTIPFRPEFEEDPESSIETYVYRRGFVPARVRWSTESDGSRTGTVRFVARSARFEWDTPESVRSIYIQRPGSFAPIATAYPSPGQTISLSLPPGQFQLTAYGDDGIVVAMQPFRVEAGQTFSPDELVDERPTVVVRLPAVESEDDEDKWWTFGGRRPLGGLISKWRAYSGGGRARPSRELDAIVEPVEERPNTFRLTFPTTGRFTIQCGHGGLPHRYFAEIDLSAGDKVELDLPALTGRILGSMPEFPDLWDFGAQHGVAGPRLALFPDHARDNRFGVLVTLPEPAEFEIDQLPTGDFLLGHHLYETGFYDSEEGHFGRVPVSLSSESSTEVGELSKDGEDRRVRIVDLAGNPIRGSIRLRDRMFEEWQIVVEAGTTLRNAMDPIPTPPTRAIEDGEVLIPDLRIGRVRGTLILESGDRIEFERDLELATVNQWSFDLSRL